MIDYGPAVFSTSPAARQIVNAANPLTPGGMNARNVHLPTLAWGIIFLIVALIVYRAVIK